MSGQEIGTVVGGVVGAFLAPYTGGMSIEWGMAIGGMIGGAVDPTKVYGPHIGQGQQQTSTDGVPIAWVIGTAKVAGCLCAVGPRREVEVDDDGKGSGTEQVTYEAHQTFAIMVCESSDLKGSTINAILMVEQDGKIVYDIRPGSNFAEASSKWKANVEFLYGGEDQMPNPTLEGIFGAGKTPAYRDRLVVLFKDFNLTPMGDRIPTYLFTVSTSADVATGEGTLPTVDFNTGAVSPFPNWTTPLGEITTYNMTGYYVDYDLRANVPGNYPLIGSMKVGAIYPYWAAGKFAYYLNTDEVETAGPHYLQTDNAHFTEIVDAMNFVRQNPADVDSKWWYRDWAPDDQYPPNFGTWCDANDFPIPDISGVGFTSPIEIDEPRLFQSFRYYEFQFSGIFETSTIRPQLTFATTGGKTLTPMGGGYWYEPSTGIIWRPEWKPALGIDTATPLPVTLKSVVDKICTRGNLAASQWNSTALASYTLEGYPIATQCAAADALLSALQAPFAFGTEVDSKILFKFYGEDVLVTINDADAVINDASDGAIQKTTRNQATEFPQKIVGTYIDPAQNYNNVTQQAERLAQTVVATGETSIQLPVAITATQAKQAVDKALKTAYAALEGTLELSVPYATANADYLTLAAGEPVFQDGKRWLLNEVDIGVNYLKLSGRYDRQSSYESNLQPVVGNPPTPPTSKYSGLTDMMVMNLPSLRSKDDFGVYIAVRGMSTSWRGATIQVSYDDQQSWQNAVTTTQQSVMGTVVSDVASSSSSDEAETVVDVGDDELSSVTDSQLAANANAFVIVDGENVAEIRQAKYATLQSSSSDSDNAYLLTRQNTGLLGTEFVLHAAGEKFTLLSKVYFVPIDLSFKGRMLYFRAVGFGEVAENQPVIGLQYDPDTTIIYDGGEVT